MLRNVSNGQFLETIRLAGKFILHVEVLFAGIGDMEFQFACLRLKGMLVGSYNFFNTDTRPQAYRT
jgi:hypothetical protein